MTGTAAPAVVVGLDCITGLQTARLLASAGIPVVGVAEAPSHFACRTRAVARVVRAPLSGPPLIDALAALGPQLEAPAVLFPCTDGAVLALSAARDLLAPWYLLRLPSHEVVELLMDKVRFAQHAAATGLPVPRTFVLRDRADLLSAAASVRYPAVVKPAIKSARWLSATSEKAIPVAADEDLLAAYDRVSSWTEALLLQEWVSGGDDALYSCNCYYDGDGRPQATFVARKLRQWPPHTGTSCLGEEVRDDEVLALTRSLLDGVGFRGLGYVETKRDPRTGQHWVIEPNVGRPTGRSAIAEAGGVPLVMTQYCDLLGLPLPAPREQRFVGAKWLDVRRDLQSSAYYWRRKELSLSEWGRSLRGPNAHAVLSARDPLPFVAELGHVARKGVTTRLAAGVDRWGVPGR